MVQKRKGLVQIFTGNGKGKTTAALGTVIRAVGHGLKAAVIFFMKGDYAYGEFSTLPCLSNVHMESFGFRQLTDPLNIKPAEIEQARLALAAAQRVVQSGDYDLVVLDEVNVALGFGMIPVEEVVELVKNKPPELELILTGRYAENELIEMADLVTEMMKVKHPFDDGIKARKGIEY